MPCKVVSILRAQFLCLSFRGTSAFDVIPQLGCELTDRLADSDDTPFICFADYRALTGCMDAKSFLSVPEAYCERRREGFHKLA